MTKCVQCGTENFEAAQYCDECGASLIKSAEKTENRQDQFKTEPNPSVFKVEAGISRASSQIENQSQAKTGFTRAKLTIERGKTAGKEFILDADETNIGRWDADNGIFPDIDLDADDPEAKVSRRHAKISREDSQFWLEDLGSTNGTFINRGRRLLPGKRQIIQDGDEIIVGKTFLRFQFIR